MWRKVSFLISVSVFVSFSATVFATDRLVPSQYATIQAAIDASVNGDTVIIADGTYTGTGNKNLDFGGKAITVRSENGPDVCIIDCQTSGRGFYFHSSETSNSIVSGLTIKNGRIVSNESQVPAVGGGIYCSTSSPAIINCTITNNVAKGYDDSMGGLWGGEAYGGGLYCESGCNPTIANCTIINNSAQGGEGGWDDPAGPPEESCGENGGSAYGGGIYCYGGTIQNCVITNNTAIGGPPGADQDCHHPVYGYAYGGGIYSNSAANITNCTIASNDAQSPAGAYGDGINGTTGGAVITNCIVWGNGDDLYNCSATYSCIEDGDTGTGNISTDPCFVSGPLGNYYLSQIAAGQATNSPCVDVGSDTAIAAKMGENTTRTDEIPDNGIVDMGYHYVSFISADIDDNFAVNFEDYAIFAADWLLCDSVNPLAGDIDRDECVDVNDLNVLADFWLNCYITSATNSTPPDNATNIERNPILSWTDSTGTLHHDVYFGTNLADVNDADTSSAVYRGQQDSTVWDSNNFNPTGLDYDTTYYWRIDEVGPACTKKGFLWHFLTTHPVCSGCDPNLVGWWKLDEFAGTRAYDSARINDGWLNGNPAWASGQINNALQFDGTGDYVTVHDNPDLRFNGSSRFTISCWVKPTAAGWLVCKMRSSGTGIFGYQLAWESALSRFRFIVEASGESSQSAYTFDNAAPAGSWYHVVAVYDNRNMKIYLNGAFHNTATFLMTIDTPPDKDLAIGARSYDFTVDNFFTGTIDDVRIYNRTLSNAEIMTMYAEGLGGEAFRPNPSIGATNVDAYTVLSWQPDSNAISHDVYLGTSFADVDSNNTPLATTDVNSFDPCGLDHGTTYYWRIDEFDGTVKHKGEIWSFTTIPAPENYLVGWWKLDETSGTTANDSALTNHGTLNGNPAWTSGQIDGALLFHGWPNTEYISVPDNSSLRFSHTSSFTISCWVNPTSGGGLVCKMRASGSGIFGSQDGLETGGLFSIFEMPFTISSI